ncbi:hypothetical protein DTL42_23385 [Bremerella cremea]|uniref:Amidohydrolase-related domain-containing protein n=1 Tax=Bremerella cremea TaxID=1031537 RepID=A0A368KL62_9BACT|nr:amidohydrolase family protein [Bremerella cremea]RCS41497.1 hypothetical protein DTL42_23385 [Bremerella cremea]
MKYSFLLSCCLVAIFSIAAWAEAPQQTSRHDEGLRRHPVEVYAITNAKVVTRPGEEPVAATIVVRNSKIVALGQDVQIPPEAEVVDLEGKYLYPGFIDSYGEVSFSAAGQRPPLAYWNQNIRSDFNVSSAIKSSDLAASDYRKQGFVARLIAPQDGILRGQTAIYSLDDGDVHYRQLRDAFALAGQLTLTRRGPRGSYPNSPMGAVALARQSFYDAAWYRDALRASEKDATLLLPETNVTLEAMQPYLAGDLPVMIETSDEQFATRADIFAREFGLDLIVIGSGREYRLLDEIVGMKRTLVVPVNFPKAPNVATPEAAAETSLLSLMHWDHAPENLARLSEKDVEILLTTHRLESPSLFLKNLSTAVERGFDANQALAAMTTVPAKRLGIDNQLGTVEEGKLASFVVTSKPLFEKDSKVVETWVNGQRYEHDQPAPKQLAGDWKIEMQSPPKDAAATLLMHLTGPKNMKGTVRPAETTPKFKEKVELKSLKYDEGRIVGQFIADKFGPRGVATLSITFEEDAESMLGTLRWPDGTVSAVTMTASGMDEAKEEKKEEAAEDGDQEDAEEEKKDDKKPQLASFPVQYPLGSFGRVSPPAEAGLIAFTGATVWTCGEQGILENATVLVSDGKIKAVGVDLEIPEDATVVDAAGLHISPGLIDCHSHIATDGGINESGQAITAEVRIGDFIDADDIDIYWQLAGGLTSSNILHGSANPIGGQNQVIKMRWGLPAEKLKFQGAPQGIKFALGENVKQANWGDEYTTRYPQTRMGVEQIFQDEFREAQEYQAAQEAYAQSKQGLPPRKDLELEAVAEILDGSRWVHCHSYRQDEILALIRVLDEFDIRIGSFQHILEGYKVADAMAQHGATASSFSDWWAYKFEVKDAIPYNGAMMHQQGLVVSFNSDDGEMGRRMNQEAAKAVKYGHVSPEEALKFVTLNAAIQLRIEDRVGSLEPGKDADLAIWNASPLSNFAVCQQTWIDGRKYFDRKEAESDKAKFAQMKNTLIQKVLDSRAPMLKEGEHTEDPSDLWPRCDEFCHAHGDHGHEHEHEHH